MGQYERHVFVCTSGETCPAQGDTEKFVKILRARVQQAGKTMDVRINRSGCFSQCGHGPMIVVYPDDVWYAGVQASDLEEILASHIIGGRPVERLRYEPGVRGPNKRHDIGKKARAPETGAAPVGPAWRRVCRADEVPVGGMKQFSVDGADVLIVDADGEFFAFQALCPHEAAPLEIGVHDGCALTCLEHLWQFDLRTGRPMGDARKGLRCYRLRLENGEVFLEL